MRVDLARVAWYAFGACGLRVADKFAVEPLVSRVDRDEVMGRDRAPTLAATGRAQPAVGVAFATRCRVHSQVELGAPPSDARGEQVRGALCRARGASDGAGAEKAVVVVGMLPVDGGDVLEPRLAARSAAPVGDQGAVGVDRTGDPRKAWGRALVVTVVDDENRAREGHRPAQREGEGDEGPSSCHGEAAVQGTRPPRRPFGRAERRTNDAHALRARARLAGRPAARHRRCSARRSGTALAPGRFAMNEEPKGGRAR